MIKKLQRPYKIIRIFINCLTSKNINIYASSGAFYTFLSVVPFIMLIGSLLPASQFDSGDISEFLQILVPSDVSVFIDGIIKEVYVYSPGVLSFSALATLWSASKSMASIMRGIEHMSNDRNKDKYIRLRLRAILYSVTVLLVLYILIMATVFISFLTSRNIISAGFIKAITPIILTFVLATAYRFIPDKRIPITKLLPGAFTAALCWTLFTAAYSLWLNSSNSYGIYGSLGSVIITLLWLYISIYIVLSGAYLNCFIMSYINKKRPI